ncbi:hypothetical protein [Gimesia sp.]|uniref:hypothetical protein n=1 Tax=Gimesia sp. TaxID=2024833 RepID=UPI003A8E8428
MSDFALKRDFLPAGNLKSERLLQIIRIDQESQISQSCWQLRQACKYTLIHYYSSRPAAYSAQSANLLDSANRHTSFVSDVIYPILAELICEKASMKLVPTRNSLNDAGMWVIAGKGIMPENAAGLWSV